MNDKSLITIASVGLSIGALLGLAGSFIPSSSLRGVVWGLDGIGLVVACSLLTIYYFKRNQDLVAAGFLVFTVGETLILSGSAMTLEASIPSFGAGVGLWSAALILISSQKVFPVIIRVFGFIASALFAIVALQIFFGQQLTPLTNPLPFFAYPFLVFTMLGWVWSLIKVQSKL
jgi:hypothetical protein